MRRNVVKFIVVFLVSMLIFDSGLAVAVIQDSSTIQTSGTVPNSFDKQEVVTSQTSSSSVGNSAMESIEDKFSVSSGNSIESTEASTDKSTTQSSTSNTKKLNARAVAADGYSEAATVAEFETQIADTTITKIRLTAPLTFDRSVTITRNVIIDFGGLNHNFGTNHIFINEQPTELEFQNFKGTATHPGGVEGNAIIQAYATDWLGRKYHFTGHLKFTGTLDLWNASKLGVVYAPRAVVTLDGVQGALDLKPLETGSTADPKNAYAFRCYQLKIINGSNLTGPYLSKFYGNLGYGDETVGTNTAPGIHILGGSKVHITYNRVANVEDEGEAIDTLPANVTFEVSGTGSEFSVDTSINITKESNQGIIQMRGSGSKVLVSNGGKIDIHTKTTGGFRLQGDSSQINVNSGGTINVAQEHDSDQPGNNGMRFVGKGLSLIVDGAGSKIDIQKKSGKSSAIRFENGNQKLQVINGATLKVKNVGDGHDYANRLNQGNQAIQFYDTSGWFEDPGVAQFVVSGEKSNIDIRADSGSAVDTSGSLDLDFTAGLKTYLVMIGRTGQDNTGIISGDALTVTLQNPTYFDFQNRRVGSTATGIGGWVFQGNEKSQISISESEIALWRKSGATFNNFEKDPDYFSDLTNLSVSGIDLGTFGYSSSAGLTSEFTQTNMGMKGYNRISANNQIPIIENLRVPTNADKKIYGHVVIPEGVDALPRDAWDGEVEVTLRLTYADTSKGAVDLTAMTKGQTNNTGIGYNPWGEGERGGLFEIQVPNDAYLQEGDTIQVISAKKVKGRQQVTELNSAKTTVDSIPPEPAVMDTTLINAATKSISGTGNPGSTATLMSGTQQIGEAVIVDATGKFTIAIPDGSVRMNDTLEVFLNDNSGEASAKGVVNKPLTNNELGNTNPSKTTLTYHDAKPFEPAPIIQVEGGLFLSAPSVISFGSIKADGLLKEAAGTTSDKLLIYDQREVKSEWTLTVKETKPLTSTGAAQTAIEEALYFASSNNNYQVLNKDAIEVATGTNTTNDPVDYSEYLSNGKGFKVILDQSKQIVGDYSAEITWTLADVPVN